MIAEDWLARCAVAAHGHPLPVEAWLDALTEPDRLLLRRADRDQAAARFLGIGLGHRLPMVPVVQTTGTLAEGHASFDCPAARRASSSVLARVEAMAGLDWTAIAAVIEERVRERLALPDHVVLSGTVYGGFWWRESPPTADLDVAVLVPGWPEAPIVGGLVVEDRRLDALIPATAVRERSLARVSVSSLPAATLSHDLQNLVTWLADSGVPAWGGPHVRGVGPARRLGDVAVTLGFALKELALGHSEVFRRRVTDVAARLGCEVPSGDSPEQARRLVEVATLRWRAHLRAAQGALSTLLEQA